MPGALSFCTFVAVSRLTVCAIAATPDLPTSIARLGVDGNGQLWTKASVIIGLIGLYSEDSGRQRTRVRRRPGEPNKNKSLAESSKRPKILKIALWQQQWQQSAKFVP
jgi:hypothetical protein